MLRIGRLYEKLNSVAKDGGIGIDTATAGSTSTRGATVRLDEIFAKHCSGREEEYKGDDYTGEKEEDRHDFEQPHLVESEAMNNQVILEEATFGEEVSLDRQQKFYA